MVPKTNGLLLSYKSKKAICLGMGAGVSSSCNSFLVNKEFSLLLLDSQSNVFCKLYLHVVRPVMSLGLIVSRIRGIIWRAMSVSSRV